MGERVGPFIWRTRVKSFLVVPRLKDPNDSLWGIHLTYTYIYLQRHRRPHTTTQFPFKCDGYMGIVIIAKRHSLFGILIFTVIWDGHDDENDVIDHVLKDTPIVAKGIFVYVLLHQLHCVLYWSTSAQWTTFFSFCIPFSAKESKAPNRKPFLQTVIFLRISA